MHRRTSILLTFAATSAVVLGSSVALLSGGASASPSDDLKAAKAATARFHSQTQAAAAGYAPFGGFHEPCIFSPAGTMGFHYENAALLDDHTMDSTRPEVLLYAPTADGGRELVAVEYVKADADQNLATTDDRPSLFGHAFDGPMPGHHPGMGVHYDLHVWLFANNPSGIFAPFNPALTCSP